MDVDRGGIGRNSGWRAQRLEINLVDAALLGEDGGRSVRGDGLRDDMYEKIPAANGR